MHYEVLVYGYDRFNTQPPEGGWFLSWYSRPEHSSFNTQPPEGGWAMLSSSHSAYSRFQHTAA